MPLPVTLINTIVEKGSVFLERLLNVFVKKVEQSADGDDSPELEAAENANELLQAQVADLSHQLAVSDVKLALHEKMLVEYKDRIEHMELMMSKAPKRDELNDEHIK